MTPIWPVRLATVWLTGAPPVPCRGTARKTSRKIRCAAASRKRLSCRAEHGQPLTVLVRHLKLVVQTLQPAVHAVVEILLPPLRRCVAEEHPASQRPAAPRCASYGGHALEWTRTATCPLASCEIRLVQKISQLYGTYHKVVLHLLELAASAALMTGRLPQADRGVRRTINRTDASQKHAVVPAFHGRINQRFRQESQQDTVPQLPPVFGCHWQLVCH